MKNASPFLQPVGIAGLNIPHHSIHYQDSNGFWDNLSQAHCIASYQTRPHEDTPRYYNTDEFITDVHLIFKNTATLNGPDHVVTAIIRKTLMS